MDEIFLVLNIFPSIAASLGNALILAALHKVSSIYPPTKLFFRCLAVADLCVGLIIQPLYATYILSRIIKMNANALFYVYQVNRAFGWIVCGVSGLTSTAISVDRLLALLLGLRYRHVVTLRRVCVAVTCFWLIGASLGWIRMWRRDFALMKTFVLIALCLATSIYCYTRIHFKLRHQQAQIQNIVPQGQANGAGIPLNIARYKKSVSSILWVQLAFVACYVPYGIVAVLDVNGIKNDVATFTTETLVYLNSSLNPILYCWKIREVRQAVKDTIRQLYCL
ncbi:hypothetical protein ACROYT_G008599 [Oculina patagonica]